MSEIETTIGGLSPEIANLIAEAPPPPIPGPSPKETKSAVKALERDADVFGRAGVDRTYLRKFGAIAAMIPGAQRIRIHKRKDGNLAYIGEYNFRDMHSTGDTEGFIAKHIKPVHGHGEYSVTIIDSNGKEYPAGSVHIEGIPAEVAGGGNGMVDLIRELALARQSGPQQLDPLESMRRAQAFAQELKATAGGDPSAMMMAMLATQRPAGPDPILLTTLERLAAKVEKIESAAAAAPPPMPLPAPPPENKTDWVAIGAQVALPLLQMMMQNQQNQQNLMVQMQQQNMQALMQLTASKNDGFTSKDAIAMMQEQHRTTLDILQRREEDGRPQNTIEDQMTALLKMKEFTQAFAPPPQAAPQGASFWDALVALASSGDMAGAIADRIRTRQSTVVDNRALPEGPQHQHHQQLPPPAQPQERTPAQQEVRIEIPPVLKDDCAKITMAGDTPSRVAALLETLMHLRSTNFSAFVDAVFTATLQNDTEQTLRGLGSFLKLCIDKGLLSRDVAANVLKDVKDNWDDIRAELGSHLPPAMRAMMTPNKVPAPQPAPQQPAPAPAPPAPAAPPAPPAPADPSVPSDLDLPDGYGGEEQQPVVVG